MKFSCSKDAFLTGAQTVDRAIPAITPDAALLNVWLAAENGKLTLFGTDGRLSLRHAVDVAVEQDGGACVPGRLLAEVAQQVQTSKSEEVSCRLHDGRLLIHSADAEYNIVTRGADAAPLQAEIGEAKTISLPSKSLRDAIRRVLVAAGSGAGLQTYEEAYFESKGGEITIVSTDSVRLSIASFRGEDGTAEFSCLMPLPALAEVAKCARSLESITLVVGSDTAAFTCGSTELRTRLSDKTFPNFRTILPKAQSRNAIVPTADFREALKGVAPLSKDSKFKTFLEFLSDRIVITSTSPEYGEARREAPAEVSGDPLKLAFNGKYLSDFLAVVDSPKFRFGVSSNSYPATLTPDGEQGGFTYILMPITHY